MTGPPNSFTVQGPVTVTAILFTQPVKFLNDPDSRLGRGKNFVHNNYAKGSERNIFINWIK